MCGALPLRRVWRSGEIVTVMRCAIAEPPVELGQGEEKV